jgi:hypothetical protein
MHTDNTVRSEVPVVCEYEDYCFLGCDIMYSARKVLMFWRKLLCPSSGHKGVLGFIKKKHEYREGGGRTRALSELMGVRRRV